MLEVDQIKKRLANALRGEESLDAFGDWLAIEAAALRSQDEDLLNLTDDILSPLQVYRDGIINESELKSELYPLIQDSPTTP